MLTEPNRKTAPKQICQANRYVINILLYAGLTIAYSRSTLTANARNAFSISIDWKKLSLKTN